MRLRLSLLVLVNFLLCQAEHTACQSDECDALVKSPRVPDTCTLVYAPVTVSSEITEWGVFSLTDRSKGTPVWNYGDIVIQVTDANQELQESVMHHFAWSGQETGGQYEGRESVDSIVPGLGMMTRLAVGSTNSNLLPLAPRVDEGGLTRFDSPGAGAITHYHNYTWFIRNPVDAGAELQMSASLRFSGVPQGDEASITSPPTVDALFSTGYCLDNIRPRKSRIKEAGRGAYATRDLPAGTIIAPVPVLPISSSALETKPFKGTTAQQLLRNYCLGNANSTTLLYPFGPFVNLINHYTRPNVKFQWSEQSKVYLSEPIAVKNPPSHLMMELVATQDIQAGEELYLDYGTSWEEAWYQHTLGWKAADFHYTPSYVMDDAIRLLRTQQEQKEHEYPDNVFTSCFYRYSDREESEKALSQSISADKVNSFQWKMTKGLYDLKNLRPCQVLRRAEDNKGRSAYAVRMLNRPGLPEEEIIPSGTLHIVTHVPRQAVRFSDKAGTTDQHMAGVFRHEIGLDDNVFPLAWMDKKQTAAETLPLEEA